MESFYRNIHSVEDYVYAYYADKTQHWSYFVKLIVIFFFGNLIPAYVFMVIEGKNEDAVKEEVELDRSSLIHALYVAAEKPDFEQEGNNLLVNYEHVILKYYNVFPLIISNLDMKIWTFWSSIVYTATVYTSLGYGELFPSTKVGRAMTIFYSLVGMPVFIIALKDFANALTSSFKFIWTSSKRLYYKGNFLIREEIDISRPMFYGIQNVHDDSMFHSSEVSFDNPFETFEYRAVSRSASVHSSQPSTSGISTFDVEPELALPVSVALLVVVLYMCLGAWMFFFLENWDYVESFYFVFTSLATIGFGDFTPNNRLAIVISIVYVFFGLSLMAVCFNVIPDKFQNKFQEFRIQEDSMEFEPSEEYLDVDFKAKDEMIQKIVDFEAESMDKMGKKELQTTDVM